MENPVGDQISRDPILTASLEKFSNEQANLVREFPMRLEPESSIYQYRDESIELSPTALMQMNDERERDLKAESERTGYRNILGSSRIDECYPFQYKNFEGVFQKKVYVNNDPSYKPYVDDATFTFEPRENQRKSPSKPYFRLCCRGQAESGVEFSFGLKNGGRYRLAEGKYDEHGNLTDISCQLGQALSGSSPKVSPREMLNELFGLKGKASTDSNSNPAGEPALTSKPGYLGFHDIKAPNLLRRKGKASYGSSHYSFGEIIIKASFKDEGERQVYEGKGARIRRIGNSLCIEGGFADNLDNPDISAAVPLKIDIRSIVSLLVSRDKKSLVDLAEKNIPVTFDSVLHGVSLSTFPLDHRLK